MTKHSDGVLDTAVSLCVKAGISMREAEREFKRSFIVAVLKESSNAHGRPNQCKAAKALGMHRNTLSRTISALGIEMPSRGMRLKSYSTSVGGKKHTMLVSQ